MNSTNNFSGLKIEYHILQSFPVSCLNRDDVGAPKTAIVGGVPRARVSSQCWKRQVRLELHNMGIPLGIRTKKVEDKLKEYAKQDNKSLEQVEKAISKAVKHLSDDTLLFISETELMGIYNYLKKNQFNESKIKDKEVYKSLGSNIRNEPLEALDIALFGRMVAKAASLNIEGSASFSHAISTHKVTNEIDFFTALDDLKDDTMDNQGAAHMGTLEYNSATYYRYISLDLGQLFVNLDNKVEAVKVEAVKVEADKVEAVYKAVDVFTKALFVAVPIARQNTQSAASLWDYAHILVRKGQRIQLHFDEPIKAEKGGGYLKPSIVSLKKDLEKKERLVGSLYGKKAELIFGEKNDYSIDQLCKDLVEQIKV